MKQLVFVSGGQTGVDRAATDAAIKNDIDYLGWIPKGRLSEDGVIPYIYDKFIETNSVEYKVRTRLNIDTSEGTVIIKYHKPLSGGTLYSLNYVKNTSKPYLILDLELDILENIERLMSWLIEYNIAILNFSGARASEVSNIYTITFEFLTEFIEYYKSSTFAAPSE
ncbi:putative molybdenum carrier protein [Francisella sp. 19X1-34]|uniref:YpsA SLOG family protein n=1 Tax=Francisella sp. 19X1-34 TaxID=3087177 RepID=UPI002E304A3E|nr:putative molybdenum carrier protein [Francisella sp. 19X1-34]MED7788073.1 putative molybdenum carrier protein [Francisella sp. 19X1-34]